MRHDSIDKRGRAARYRRWPAASVSAVLAVAALGVENVGPASAAGRNEVSPQAASSSCKPGATPSYLLGLGLPPQHHNGLQQHPPGDLRRNGRRRRVRN